MPVPVQPPVNALAEIDGDLGPSPPEHDQYSVDSHHSQEHVVTKKETGEEEDDKADGDEREKYSRNQRDEKKH